MNRSLLCPLVLVVGAAGLAAQVDSPAPLAYHAGSAATGYPIGYAAVRKMTYQQVHAGIPSSVTINALAWRPASGASAHGAFTARMTVRFGDQGPTPSAATGTFATNLGANPTVVINDKTLNVAAHTPPAAAPAAFHYAFPLDTPFAYTGSGNLTWEARIHDHSLAGNITFDLWQSSVSLRLTAGGQGCVASGASSPMELSGVYNGTDITLTANSGPTTGGALLLVGFNNTPIDLTGIGAPCALRTNTAVVVPGTGTGTQQTWKAPLTVTPANDVGVYLQAAALDPAANALGLVVSNGLAAVWPYADLPVVRIWSTLGDTETTGSLQPTIGLVTRFGQ